MEAMENYYYQLVLTLHSKLGTTTQKLSHCKQQLKKLVAKEEWVKKQQAHEELLDSLTNKLDKFSNKLATRRAKKSRNYNIQELNLTYLEKITSKGPITKSAGANSPIKIEREYHLDIGTIEQTNKGLNDIIRNKLKIGRNAYLEPL